jgi:CDGSH-type Zn-finger protein
MARLVRHDAIGPAVIDVDGKIVEICQCGLSKMKPFCEMSHEKVRGEEPGQLYIYGEAGERVKVTDMFPQPRKKFTPPVYD